MPDFPEAVPTEVIAPASGRQFRAFPRVACPPDFQARFLIRPNFCPQKAFVGDISVGGVALLSPRPLAAGTLLAVQLGGWGEPECLVVPARVVYCIPYQGPWWRIGCQLTRPLTRAEFHALVDG
jgi:hypothetical protein